MQSVEVVEVHDQIITDNALQLAAFTGDINACPHTQPVEDRGKDKEPQADRLNVEPECSDIDHDHEDVEPQPGRGTCKEKPEIPAAPAGRYSSRKGPRCGFAIGIQCQDEIFFYSLP